MMNNLFIMFDPTTNFMSLNWMSLFLPLIFIKKCYFNSQNRISHIMENINFLILKDLKMNLKKKHYKIMMMLIIMFNMIWMMNMLSLLPFIFTPTSHMSLTLILSLPLWISLTSKMLFMNTSQFFCHLVPLSTPLMLTPFMVIIETISSVIRPLTLMIRLTANMIAGHILMHLLSELLNMNLIFFVPTSLVMNILYVLEMSVSMIQGYVFTILMSLYIEETN
uniref:ATP synthase subunit a n=1 Tax=Euseius sacchari TaxID=3061191 RepID=A0AAU6PCN0_9ACAR